MRSQVGGRSQGGCDIPGRLGREVAKTPDCIFTPVGMPSSGQGIAGHFEDVARRAIAPGKQDEVDTGRLHRAGGGLGIGGR